MSKEFEQEIVELWEVCVNNLFDKEAYVDNLEKLLGDKRITKKDFILDVAGGFGFPVIELTKRGYHIVYNDASRAMFERAIKNAELADAPRYPFLLSSFGIELVGTTPWQFFGELKANFWNALICKGNSLPYVISWGRDSIDLSLAHEDINKALTEFYRILAPGGILYVDKQPEEENEAKENFGIVTVGGRKVQTTWSVENDKINRIRYWTMKTKDVETGEEKTYPSKGYLLLEDELVDMLKKVGFREIGKHILDGDIYEGFVARK